MMGVRMFGVATALALAVCAVLWATPALAATAAVSWDDPVEGTPIDIVKLQIWTSADDLHLQVDIAAPIAADFGGSIIHLLVDTDDDAASGSPLAASGSEYDLYVRPRLPGEADPAPYHFVSQKYSSEGGGTMQAFPGASGNVFAASVNVSISLFDLDLPSRVSVVAIILTSGAVVSDRVPDVGRAGHNIEDVPSPPTFTDVPPGHSYATAIGELARLEIVGGYPDDTFRPANPLWRAQFAKMIIGTLGLPCSESDVSPFADVEDGGPDTLYPDNFIAVAYAFGITYGTSPATFSPYRNITRAQVVTMVVRAMDSIHPTTLAAPPESYRATWGDFDPTHGTSTRRAEYNGLLDGLPVTELDPWGDMSRGEVAQILYNVLPLLYWWEDHGG